MAVSRKRTSVPVVPPPQFNEDWLWSLQISKAALEEFGEGLTVLIVDYARSSNRRSDESAICAARIISDGITKTYVVLNVISDRWGILELPWQIVEAAKKYNAGAIYIERLSNWELIGQEIGRIAKKRGIDLGRVIFFKPDQTPNAKSNRLAKLHRLTERGGSVRFVSGNYLNKLFSQLVGYSWVRRNKGRKDDAADVVALLVTHT